MKKRYLRKNIPGWKDKTGLEQEELTGKVKQVMQTCYKAHQKGGVVFAGKIEMGSSDFDDKNFIFTFNEKGVKVKDQNFDGSIHEIKIYNERGLHVESFKYNKDGSLNQQSILVYNDKPSYCYDNGQMLEYIVRDADGNLQHKSTHKYNEAGYPLEDVMYYRSEDKIHQRTVREYDATGKNQVSCIQYDGDGNVKHRHFFKFNEQGRQIESSSESTDPKMAAYNSRSTSKCNEKGDIIETTSYNPDGSVKDTYTYNPEYDADGKIIIPYRPDCDYYAKVAGETETDELDAHGNWIKKTTFFNKVPLNIFIREISYYGEPSEKNEPFVHILSNPLTEAVEAKEEDDNEKEEPKEQMTEEQAKWLVDFPNASPDNFSPLRYYAILYKEAPSLLVYSYDNIEALHLKDELTEEMDAEEIHSYCTVEGYGDHIVRYTLHFPGKGGYLLHAAGISANYEGEFEVPDFLDNSNDGYFYTTGFQLLRPSEASGRRDEDFEMELETYIQKYSIKEKPDQPTIYMIEVNMNNFAMVSHPVEDNFEIKDLDLNYGYGFAKFHSELMGRFNNSTKGLVLFHGQPGTGKTYYIRHLLRAMATGKKIVIYMPPNMVDHLTEPAFMTFLSHTVQNWSASGNFCVLLIEDAEPLLAKRQEGVRIQGVTNLLNMTDGLLNDMLNLQIICTFNVDLKKLDSALLRPGRLIARKEFKPLSKLDANILGQRLGIKHHFTSSATLGEIFAMQKDKNTLIHDVEADKDASKPIDDF